MVFIEVIEVTISIFDLNDLILTSIKIDSESHFHINKFRFTQSIFLHSLHEFWNTASPGFHKVHIGKSIGECTISDF